MTWVSMTASMFFFSQSGGALARSESRYIGVVEDLASGFGAFFGDAGGDDDGLAGGAVVDARDDGVVA